MAKDKPEKKKKRTSEGALAAVDEDVGMEGNEVRGQCFVIVFKTASHEDSEVREEE